MNMPNEQRSAAPQAERQTPWRLIAGVVIVVALVVFIVENQHEQRIWFVFFPVTTRIWIALLVAVAFGVVLDRVFISWRRRRKAAKDNA